MKKLILSLLPFLLLLSNCTKKGEDVYFNLRIITFESFNGSATDKFPVEIQRLCKAFEKPTKYSVKVIPVIIDIIRLSDSNFYERNILNVTNDKSAGNPKYREYLFKKHFDTARLGTGLTSENALSIEISSILSNYNSFKKMNNPITFLFTDSKIDKHLIFDQYSNIDSMVDAINRTLLLENNKNINIIISPAGKLISVISEGSLFIPENSDSKKISRNDAKISDLPKQPTPFVIENKIKDTPKIGNSDSISNNTSKTKINKGSVIPKKTEEPASVKTVPAVFRISLKTQTIEWTNLGEGFQYELTVQNRKGEGENYSFNRIIESNTIDISEFNIKDLRIYNLTLKAKSKDRQETKTITFNLIKNGSIIDPRCKSK